MKPTNDILIVDDEEVVRLAYARTLASARCNVEMAWNGKNALDAMERHSFDVVLLDLRMPGMDGITVLKTMKQKWPESEVIVITGYPSVETAKEALRLGAYDYLAKPLGPDDVISAASGAMEQKRWSLHKYQRGPDAGTGSGNHPRLSVGGPAF
jgi:DNA-binding NtrC family response regulator